MKFPLIEVKPLERPEFKPRPHMGIDPNLSKDWLLVLDYLDVNEQQTNWLIQSSIESREIESDTRQLLIYAIICFILISGPQLYSLFLGWWQK